MRTGPRSSRRKQCVLEQVQGGLENELRLEEQWVSRSWLWDRFWWRTELTGRAVVLDVACPLLSWCQVQSQGMQSPARENMGPGLRWGKGRKRPEKSQVAPSLSTQLGMLPGTAGSQSSPSCYP